MNYTPLPSTLISQPPTTHSPYKKALATILIAMFLGIGTTYAYFRNSTPAEVTPDTTPIITVIPSPLPTVVQQETLPTTDPDLIDETLSCPAGMVRVCEGGVCSCDSSFGTSPTISPTSNPTLFSCSAGTVKVCQGGDCECVSNNQ